VPRDAPAIKGDSSQGLCSIGSCGSVSDLASSGKAESLFIDHVPSTHLVCLWYTVGVSGLLFLAIGCVSYSAGCHNHWGPKIENGGSAESAPQPSTPFWVAEGVRQGLSQ